MFDSCDYDRLAESRDAVLTVLQALYALCTQTCLELRPNTYHSWTMNGPNPMNPAPSP